MTNSAKKSTYSDEEVIDLFNNTVDELLRLHAQDINNRFNHPDPLRGTHIGEIEIGKEDQNKIKSSIIRILSEGKEEEQRRVIEQAIAAHDYSRGMETIISHDMKSEDEIRLRSFLLGFRLLTADKSHIKVSKVINAMRQIGVSERVNEILTKIGKHIKGISRRNNFVFKGVADREISTGEAIDLFLNGFYFHSDIEKRQPLKDEMTRSIFRMRMIDQACFMFSDIELIKTIFSKRDDAAALNDLEVITNSLHY